MDRAPSGLRAGLAFLKAGLTALAMALVVSACTMARPGAGAAPAPAGDEKPALALRTDSGRTISPPSAAKEHQPDKEKERPAAGKATVVTNNVGAATALVRAGLILRISVMVAGKKEIEEATLRVSDEGDIRLPFLGSVAVAGMRLSEVTDLLTERYRSYFVNPQLVVEFAAAQAEGAAPWGKVTILGRVRNPGSIPLPPTRDLTVSAAIQTAGGFDTSADQGDIRVTRRSENGEPKVERVNMKAVGARGEAAQDMILEDGDIVFVPERIF